MKAGTLITKPFLSSAQSAKVFCGLRNFVCKQLQENTMDIAHTVLVHGTTTGPSSRLPLQLKLRGRFYSSISGTGAAQGRNQTEGAGLHRPPPLAARGPGAPWLPAFTFAGAAFYRRGLPAARACDSATREAMGGCAGERYPAPGLHRAEASRLAAPRGRRSAGRWTRAPPARARPMTGERRQRPPRRHFGAQVPGGGGTGGLPPGGGHF